MINETASIGSRKITPVCLPIRVRIVVHAFYSQIICKNLECGAATTITLYLRK